jgi:hypothetical protein
MASFCTVLRSPNGLWDGYGNNIRTSRASIHRPWLTQRHRIERLDPIDAGLTGPWIRQLVYSVQDVVDGILYGEFMFA